MHHALHNKEDEKKNIAENMSKKEGWEMPVMWYFLLSLP